MKFKYVRMNEGPNAKEERPFWSHLVLKNLESHNEEKAIGFKERKL